MGIVTGDKLNTAFHEARDKMDVAGESIQLGNDERGLLTPCYLHGLPQVVGDLYVYHFQFRSVRQYTDY